MNCPAGISERSALCYMNGCGQSPPSMCRRHTSLPKATSLAKRHHWPVRASIITDRCGLRPPEIAHCTLLIAKLNTAGCGAEPRPQRAEGTYHARSAYHCRRQYHLPVRANITAAACRRSARQGKYHCGGLPPLRQSSTHRAARLLALSFIPCYNHRVGARASVWRRLRQ